MLATLREPPPRGSVQSYVLQALLIRKDIIEYQRVRTLTQAIVNKDEAKNVLDEYRDALMPYLKKIRANDRQEHIKRLMSEVARGPIAITPVMQKQVKSKLKTRVIQRDGEDRMTADRKLSRKIGGIL